MENGAGTSADQASALPTTGRAEALSDGIIAIAATLLVLELHVPEVGEDVWLSLAHQLPSLAAYAVSFLTILIFWVNHHALFHAVARVDRTLLFLNGLLLLGISFVSFPTAALGRVSAPVSLVVAAVVAGYFTVTPRHLRRPVA
jgi:TMEM175 potassium channel family protein